MTTTITTANEVKQGNQLIENGGSIFPVLEVTTDNGKTSIKIDTSAYFLSFKSNTKTLTLKSTQRVRVLA
jgi:preprotein translocase subunit YajC